MTRRLVRTVAVAVLLASPWVMSHAEAHRSWVPVAALMAALQGYAASRALSRNLRLPGGLAGIVLPAALVTIYPGSTLSVWPGLLQGLICFALCLLFAQSLRPHATPLVTHFATLVRGPLPPALRRYTWGVTLMWAVFFASQIALSLLMFLFASRQHWLFFVSTATGPLAVLLFLVEFLYRRIHLRGHQQETLADMARLFADFRADPARFRP